VLAQLGCSVGTSAATLGNGQRGCAVDAGAALLQGGEAAAAQRCVASGATRAPKALRERASVAKRSERCDARAKGAARARERSEA